MFDESEYTYVNITSGDFEVAEDELPIKHASDNFKYGGQTDVAFSELQKTIEEYQAIVGGTSVKISRAEEIIDDVITYLKAIESGTTYRTSPVYVGKVARDALKRNIFPQIYVGISSSSVSPHDQVPSAFMERFSVYIVGYVKNQTDGQHAGNLTDLMEALIQDCKKALLPKIVENINTEKWFIDIHNQAMQIERSIDIEQSMGEFALTFRAVAYAEDFRTEIEAQ